MFGFFVFRFIAFYLGRRPFSKVTLVLFFYCRFLLQRIFLTQWSNPGLLHCWQMLYHLSHQGSPTIKKAECQRIDAFELGCWRRLLRVPWTLKKIKPVNPKGNQSLIFIGRTDAEAETPILWPSDGKNWLLKKDPDAGKDWRQEEKGTTEDEMVGWHHQFDGHEFEQAPGVGDG